MADNQQNKIGRPPVADENRHIKISISIPPRTYHELERYCATYGSSKSKVATKALDYWLMFEK